MGNFNGDGDPDLAVANELSNNVSVLLGGPGGTFSAPTNFAAGSGPQSVAVGDFNGDGDPDLAVANSFSNNVSVLLGQAGGTFGDPTNFPVGAGPVSVAVGGFDGDGDRDLALTGPPSNSVSVLLNIGRQASLPAVVRSSTTWLLRDSLTSGVPTITFSLGTKPLVPFTGDWDGNGSETPGVYSGGVLRLYDQIPPEDSPTQITFGDPRGFPVAGDFDGDGRDDVAIYRNGTWQIRFADDGETSMVSFGSGSWPSTVPVAGDWNGDGTDGIGTSTLATGTWNLRQTASSGAADAGSFVFWTGSGSYPVVGDWDGSGTDTVGVKNGTIWSLNNQNDTSAPEITFQYGLANDLPLTWKPGAPTPRQICAQELAAAGLTAPSNANYILGTPGNDDFTPDDRGQRRGLRLCRNRQDRSRGR